VAGGGDDDDDGGGGSSRLVAIHRDDTVDMDNDDDADDTTERVDEQVLILSRLLEVADFDCATINQHRVGQQYLFSYRSKLYLSYRSLLFTIE
jgi:hypothetical protein